MRLECYEVGPDEGLISWSKSIDGKTWIVRVQGSGGSTYVTGDQLDETVQRALAVWHRIEHRL